MHIQVETLYFYDINLIILEKFKGLSQMEDFTLRRLVIVYSVFF